MRHQALAELLREIIVNRGPLLEAKRVHQVVASAGLASDTFLGNHVVQMYGVCGSPQDATAAFYAISRRNSFSWNLLLRAYTQNRDVANSRGVFEKMPHRDTVSGTLMVTLLGRFGVVDDAKSFFDEMPETNVVTWNALIAAYAQKGDAGEVSKLFRAMRERDMVSWITLLGSYASAGPPEEARRVFDRMPVYCDYAAVTMIQTYANSAGLRDGRAVFYSLKLEQQANAAICCAMIVCHAKSGEVDEAWSMFVLMDTRNRVSWNVMLATFGSYSQVDKARDVFDRMPQRDVVTWNSMLHAFACSALSGDAKTLFDHMPARDVVSWATLAKVYSCAQVLERMPERNIVTWNSLLAMYTKQGQLSSALSVFWDMQQKDVVSWNTMLQCLLQVGVHVEAARFFSALPAWDEVSSTMMIQWYGTMRDIDSAVFVFEQVASNMMVPWSAMVTAYCQNGHLIKAKELFDRMPVKNTVAWNSLIAGYAQQGYAEDAIVVFALMDLEGAKIDVVSFVSALDACSKINCLWLGRLLVQESKLVVQDTILATAVVNMYGKCGNIDDAKRSFEQASVRDKVLWSALIAAYVQNGRGDEALQTFKFMDLEGWEPDEVTLTSVVDACVGSASFPDPALWVCLLECSGSIKLCNAILNLFGKCGQFDQTITIFERMAVRDTVTWTTLVTMYAQNGMADKSVNVFREMEHDGLRPEGVTMISLLSACSHAGMAELCRSYLVSLTVDYGLQPLIEHYDCVVDGLCRVGELGMAYDLILNMPYVPTSVSWLAMLSMSKTYGDKEYGFLAAQEAVKFDPASSLHYIVWLIAED